MNDTVLEIRNLEKTFFSKNENLTILRNLSLTVNKGESCVIAGMSGSGKSTLLNIIAGLEEATSGSVLFCGNELSGMSENELAAWRKKNLGMVFQFHHLLKDFTALENVFLPLYMAGESKAAARDRAVSLLEEVGLSDRMNHLPS